MCGGMYARMCDCMHGCVPEAGNCIWDAFSSLSPEFLPMIKETVSVGTMSTLNAGSANISSCGDGATVDGSEQRYGQESTPEVLSAIKCLHEEVMSLGRRVDDAVCVSKTTAPSLVPTAVVHSSESDQQPTSSPTFRPRSPPKYVSKETPRLISRQHAPW